MWISDIHRYTIAGYRTHSSRESGVCRQIFVWPDTGIDSPFCGSGRLWIQKIQRFCAASVDHIAFRMVWLDNDPRLPTGQLLGGFEQSGVGIDVIDWKTPTLLNLLATDLIRKEDFVGARFVLNNPRTHHARPKHVQPSSCGIGDREFRFSHSAYAPIHSI